MGEKSALTTSEGQVTRIESTHVILEAVRSKFSHTLWRGFCYLKRMQLNRINCTRTSHFNTKRPCGEDIAPTSSLGLWSPR